MARIGLRDLYVHEITQETTTEVTYDTAEKLSEAIEVQVTPQTTSDDLYADDQLSENVASLSKYDITLNVKDITPEMQGRLLGQEVNEEGMVYSSADLDAPYFGVSFKAERTDGSFEYRQLFKVKFAPTDSTYQTKGENVNFQTDTITGTSLPLLKNRLFDTRVVGTAENKSITDNWHTEIYTDVELD